MKDNLLFIDLNHSSPELDAAYGVISRDISPEYLETAEFLKNRLAVRDKGARSDRERILVQDGYTLHLIAAKEGKKIVGAIYGHLISKIGIENRGIGFVTYIAVLPEYRRQGIGTRLIQQLAERVNADTQPITGKPIMGMVFEIEENGKEEIKGAVSKLGARPLDIIYFQPALRKGYEPGQMHLWFQPLPPLPPEAMADFKLPASLVTDMVRNMLVMEYVGPEMKGFDLASKPYQAFLDSVKGRKEIGCIIKKRQGSV